MINLINQTWNRHDKIHKTCNKLNNIVTAFRKKPPCNDAQQLINQEQFRAGYCRVGRSKLDNQNPSFVISISGARIRFLNTSPETQFTIENVQEENFHWILNFATLQMAFALPIPYLINLLIFNSVNLTNLSQVIKLILCMFSSCRQKLHTTANTLA